MAFEPFNPPLAERYSRSLLVRKLAELKARDPRLYWLALLGSGAISLMVFTTIPAALALFALGMTHMAVVKKLENRSAQSEPAPLPAAVAA